MATAAALLRRVPDARVSAVGTREGLEAQLIPARGFELSFIPRVPLPRRPAVSVLTLPLRLRTAIKAVREVIERVQPDVVVGFGGYVALPAYLAARRAKVPFVVHEANARPGLANRIGSRMTRWVATSTPDSALPHARFTGIPLRQAIVTLDRDASRAAARALWQLDADRPTLLVFGGSQGADRINRAAAGSAKRLLELGFQVLHGAGRGNSVEVTALAGDPHYVVVPYIDNMEQAYAAADLVLCRSGAMTCAELAAVGLPAVYVPYPHSNGEQEVNASLLVSAGGGMLIPDEELSSHRVVDTIGPLLANGDLLDEMGRRAASLGHRDADERLVDMVLAAAGWPA